MVFGGFDRGDDFRASRVGLAGECYSGVFRESTVVIQDVYDAHRRPGSGINIRFMRFTRGRSPGGGER